MARGQVSLYIDKDSYKRLKELVAPEPVCHEVDRFIAQRIAELEDREYDPLEHIDYEALKKEYKGVIKELDSLEKDLKHKDVYEDLKVLAVQVGVDTKDLTNVQEISGPFLEQWQGRPEHAHLFIDLMECVQRKHQIEHQLEGIRKKALNP